VLADDGGVGRGSLAAAQLAYHLGALRGCQAAAEFSCAACSATRRGTGDDLRHHHPPRACASHRPGIRFGLIDQALDPVTGILGLPAQRLAQLKNDLAAVISADALFPLTDLCRLSPDEAVSSLVRTATTITATATCGDSPVSSPPPSAPRQPRRR